ncbi:MAG TPA: hypothetical protein VIN10_02435, partial [Bacteroidales bacterium]
MIKQLVFAISVLITLGIFAWTMQRIFKYFKFTKKKPLDEFGKRFWVMVQVAFFQEKILRKPVIGLMHALVWWGFIVILFGSIEMVIDGLFGTERALFFLGPVYDFIMASGDIFAFIISLAVLAFLFRRLFMHVKRFYGPEMKPVSKADANLALTIILVLMLTLLGMNTSYIIWSNGVGNEILGVYPVSSYLAGFFQNTTPASAGFWHEFNWWAHILLIFAFANILPYSKHFHV